METVVRKIHFCYGHRVMKHESKCATLHGHNGVIWVHASPLKSLDKLGRVIDFSVLKDSIGGWVDKYWDHTMILFKDDKKTIELCKKAPAYKELFILPENPTVENLAKYLLYEVCPKLLKGKGVIVHKITIFETENCYGEASIDPNDKKMRALYK